MNSRTTNIIFKAIFATWLILWVVFLVREDKKGQYKDLWYFYTHGYNEKVRYILGEDLHDFLIYCKENIPEGASYSLSGFGEFDIASVRARYFLWPLRCGEENADYYIACKEEKNPDGYKIVGRHKVTGVGAYRDTPLLFKREKVL